MTAASLLPTGTLEPLGGPVPNLAGADPAVLDRAAITLGPADRRSDHEVMVLSRRFDSVCTHAVDPEDIAVGLEAAGFTDAMVAETYGFADVFDLADELFRCTPRRVGQERLTGLPNPWVVQPRQHLLRGVLFGVPGLVYAALPGSRSTLEVAVLASALLIGWSCGQVVAYLGYSLSAVGREAAAYTWILTALIAGLTAATGLAVVVHLAGVRTAIVAVAWGQIVYMLAAACLLTMGRERLMLLALIPGVIGALAYLLVPGPVTAAIAACGAGLLLLAVFVPAAVLSVRRARGASGRALRLDVATVRMTGWHAGYGVAAGALVVLPSLLNPQAGRLFALALLPLVWSMGAAEWQLVAFRRRSYELTERSRGFAEFGRDSRLAALRCLLIYTAVLAGLTVALLAVVRPGSAELAQAAPALIAGSLLGVAFVCALLFISCGALREVVLLLSAATLLGAIGQLWPGGPWQLIIAPALASGVLLSRCALKVSDPTWL